MGAGEDFGEFGDERAGGGAACDDRGEFPPDCGINRWVAFKQEIGGDVGGDDGDEAGHEDEACEGPFEIHDIGVGIFCVGDRFVDEVGDAAGQHHDQTHGKDPDQQRALDGRGHRQQDEGDEGHAGNAVGFKTIRGGSDAVAGVVAGAVGDDAGVSGIIFLDVEDDLHEVSADVGDLGENAAGHAQGGSAQRFTDRKSDEAWSGIISRHK